MFDNRWDNWTSDFADSVDARQFAGVVREFIPDILSTFGDAVREIDRAIAAARRKPRVPAALVARAQHAIDRADVLIGALLPA